MTAVLITADEPLIVEEVTEILLEGVGDFAITRRKDGRVLLKRLPDKEENDARH